MFRTAISSSRTLEARQISRLTISNSSSAQSALRYLPRRPITTSALSKSPLPTRIKARPNTTFTFSANQRPSPSSILQRLRSSTTRHFHNSKSGRNAGGNSAKVEGDPNTLSGRLKRLIREYGWSVVGVYFFLSALDFPFCYLLVRTLGTDRIGEWEHFIVSNAKKLVPESVQTFWHEWRSSMKAAEEEMTGSEKVNDAAEMVGWGVEEAEQANKRDASLGTQLALAYAIHKSFMFIRVPLTAAVTPKIVKTLRSWGWDIGKRTTKEAKKVKAAAYAASKASKKKK